MTARATPLTMPLSGVRLVEASAGTGKTFTIATLYLRLILERALTPEQIVVATFTRAATAELATRLRKRLRLAADILRADDPARARAEDDGDTQATRAVIAGVLDRNDDDVATLASRARDAELAMDTAVIGTLHGFCHRILSEFGFETGRALGQLELLEDSRALQQEIVKDFWRTCSTDAEAARLLAETWRTPDALALQVRDPRWRGRHIVAGESTQMSAQARRALRQEALARLDAIRNAIAGWDESTLQAADRELAECFDKRGWSARDARSRGLREVHAWAQSGIAADLLSAKASKAVEELSERVMSSKPSCKRMPKGQVFAAVADLDAGITLLEQLDRAAGARLLLDARAYLERELPVRMKALGVLGYDQAIDELSAALLDPQRGARAVQAIRARWPVALVDEFQDTDPQQWTILQTLFAHGDGALVLVGDPKQAIYGFRGGDVHAWLMAKAQAHGASLQLEESQRAGTGVNAAINALFSREHAFIENGIAHGNVRSAARVRQRALLVDGEPAPGLQLWQLPASGTTHKNGNTKPRGKAEAQSAIEAACVTQIVEWLERARQGQVQLREGDGGTRQLCAADMAVLVNSNAQAKSMQRVLARAGVPAASCLRASIYASDEANDMRLLLEALRDPADSRRARAARASVLIGAEAQAIAQTCQNGSALDALLEETAEWAGLVERRGPLPLLQRLIACAAPRLLAQPGGERRVANYLQLAELLQSDHAMCFGIDDLCELYARALRENAADTDADAVRLRLDTDRQAVQIATLHAAKGLEYSVVFLPCAAAGFAPGKMQGNWPALTWYHADDRACVAVGDETDPAIGRRALDELRAEEIRKFYVGVTRARVACVMPWGCINQGEHTAAHWLLHVAGREAALPFDEAGCDQALRDVVARGNGDVRVQPLPAASTKRLSTTPAAHAEIAAANFQGRIEHDWRIWSFSRLVRSARGADDADPAPGSGDAALTSDATLAPHASAPAINQPVLAGARFGSAVHAALEHADFAAWRDVANIPDTQRLLVERGLRAQGLPEPGSISMERAVALAGDCVRSALNVPLACGLRLCELAPAQRRAEMEFHLRLASARAEDLFALLHAYGYQRGRNGVGSERLHGLLTGVIDLVFEHGGRYHLIDYKTNYLPSGYHAASLQAAIDQHDYDLQYLLYTLALHRWLRQALPDYAYELHMGEAYYLFVRGVQAGEGVHRDRPPHALIEAMDALFDTRAELAA